MPCRILTSSNWFSQALSAINSPKSCVVARVARLPRRSRRRSRTFSAGNLDTCTRLPLDMASFRAEALTLITGGSTMSQTDRA